MVKSNDVIRENPNTALLLKSTRIISREVPGYGMVPYDTEGILVALADNNDEDLDAFHEIVAQLSSDGVDIYVFYNFPYNETVEEYMSNYEKLS